MRMEWSGSAVDNPRGTFGCLNFQVFVLIIFILARLALVQARTSNFAHP